MRELNRVIIPEILDSLNPADPRAIRSRRDLQWIDLYLGNSRWIVRQLKKPTSPLARIIEIGAGEGDLLIFPRKRVEGLFGYSGLWFRGDSKSSGDL